MYYETLLESHTNRNYFSHAIMLRDANNIIENLMTIVSLVFVIVSISQYRKSIEKKSIKTGLFVVFSCGVMSGLINMMFSVITGISYENFFFPLYISLLSLICLTLATAFIKLRDAIFK